MNDIKKKTKLSKKSLISIFVLFGIIIGIAAYRLYDLLPDDRPGQQYYADISSQEAKQKILDTYSITLSGSEKISDFYRYNSAEVLFVFEIKGCNDFDDFKVRNSNLLEIMDEYEYDYKNPFSEFDSTSKGKMAVYYHDFKNKVYIVSAYITKQMTEELQLGNIGELELSVIELYNELDGAPIEDATNDKN